MIRFANLNDFKYCAELEKDAFLDPWNEKTFEDIAKNSEFYKIVVCEFDEITGYAIYSSVFGSVEIMRITTKKEFRRKGIAQQILDFVFTEEKKKGIVECFLEVRVSNTPAKAFYEKNGFKMISKRLKYYSNGEDAEIYKLEF